MDLREKGIETIFAELRKAEAKFPGWPNDPVHGAAVVGEEFGELLQAALDLYYGREQGLEKILKEATQTAAVAIRMVVWIMDQKKEKRAMEPHQACRVCGCTDDQACEGGCYWVSYDLCSACVSKRKRKGTR